MRVTRVHRISNRSCTLVALAMGVALSGCSGSDFDTSQWFQKPLDLFGREGGYTYSELKETAQQRPITANDLVQQNGACPAPPAVAQPQPPAANNPSATPAPAVAGGADSLLGGGVALGMSECDVVYRAGPPSAVQLGQYPNGDRTAQLTFNSGPRPGIYRFERGRLVEMDQTAVPAPPPEAKSAAKKKKKPAAAPQQVSTQ
jgi:hypothetical protein